MRVLILGALVAAVAAGAAGCGGVPQGDSQASPALVATGNERLVTLKLPGMT